MPWTDALIRVPRFAPLPSGLIVPTELARPKVSEDGRELEGGMPIPEEAMFIMANPPSALEQMRIVIDEGGLQLKQSTPAGLRGMAGRLSFENGMVALARLEAHIWHIRGDLDAQLALAPEIFGDPDFVARVRRLAKAEPDRLEIFPEQHSAALQRLLVLFAKEGTPGTAQDGEQDVFNRAYVAAATLTTEYEKEPPSGLEGRAHWLAYLIQNGTYNRREDSLSSMIRPQILLRDIADGEAARSHPDFCHLERWHRESFGFGFAEQFALGFAICAGTGIFNESASIAERSVIGPAYLIDLVAKLDGDLNKALNLVSAPRDWYRAEFESRGDSDLVAAWDRIPFEVRPLLRLGAGGLLVLSPRALESWLGDGFYHRSLAAARERDEVERFQSFYGALVEEYAVRVLRHVQEEIRPPAIGRVFGEQRYGRGGGKKSPDIAVDCGTDLVLFEVTSGRFTLRTVLDGSPEGALADLGRLLFKKAGQLDRRIGDFLDGQWHPPDVDPNHIQRIWPVIVTADVLQNEMLWGEIRDRIGGLFSQPKVQRLTILDLADLEQITALVERGHGLLDLIMRKARGPYAELDFRRFVFETPGLPKEIRLSLLDERWFAEVDQTASAFGLDLKSPEAVRRRRELREAMKAR
jgi:hypothetical protein